MIAVTFLLCVDTNLNLAPMGRMLEELEEFYYFVSDNS